MGDSKDTKRILAPTIDCDVGWLIDKSHIGDCQPRVLFHSDISKKCGAAAASCAIGSSKFVSDLRKRLLSSSPHFSSSLVTSRQNKLFWPETNFANVDKQEGEVEKTPSALFFANQFFFENLLNNKVLCSVTLPSDQATKFFDNLAREESKKKFYFFSDFADSLALLPSISRSVSLLDVVTSITNNYRLIANIKSFSISCASSSGSEDELISFVQRGKKLESFSLCNCFFRQMARTVLPEVQKTSISTLELQENDLGVEDEQTEDIVAALADLLKYDKFLRKLNISYNHFTPKQIRSFLDALASSDTTLTPDDLPPEPEEEIIPIENYVNRELFFGISESENEEDDSEEDEEEETPEPNDSLNEEGNSKKNDEEEEEDEENEEEEDEENENSRTNDDNEDDEEEEEKKVDPTLVRKFKLLFLKIFREEDKGRRQIMEEYISELMSGVYEKITGIRERKEKEKQDRIDKYCQRRSGWSQLEELNLRGNRVGDIGATGVALILRDEVQRTQEEVNKIEDTLREKNDVILNELLKEREATTAAEIEAFRSLLQDQKQELRTLLERQRGGPLPKDTRSESSFRGNEEKTNKEQPKRRSSIVFTDMDEKEEEDDEEEDRPVLPLPDEEEEVPPGSTGGEEEEIEGDDDDDIAVEREGEVEDREPWNFKVRLTKKGLNSFRVLDLGGCEISSRGLKKIASSLESNKKLETLILRNNQKFAVLFQSVEGIEGEDEDDEGSLPERKVDVPHYVSPGFESFSSMLKVNAVLKHLDLGFCQLSPDSINLLSLSLRANSTLEYLNLEGNRIGEAVGPLDVGRMGLPPEENANLPHRKDEQDESSGTHPEVVETLLSPTTMSCLLQLMQALRMGGSVKHLHLNRMNLSTAFQKDEAAALGELSSKQLLTLEMNTVGFNASHMTMWSEALEEQWVGIASLRSLHLNCNEFSGSIDGEAIGKVIERLKSSLVDFSIDDNPKLASEGVAAALQPFFSSSVLRSLSANHTGITTVALADGSAVLSPCLVSSLRYLSLGDMSSGTIEELTEWILHLQSHATELQYLSMWSRYLDMEKNLDPFSPLIDSLPQLLYIDFGVLLRFDMYPPDVVDILGSVEQRLTARRLQKCFKDVPVVLPEVTCLEKVEKLSSVGSAALK